ncbi:MAG: alpha-hydroxy acid oxidase [Pseudomonadota bacterium]
MRDYEVLHEFAKAAKDNLKRGTWDYLIGAAETETTVKRNRHAIETYALRPRVLKDVSDVDPSVIFQGLNLRIPVILAPIGSLQDFEPGGGATAARGATDFGVVSMLSSACEPGLEAVAEAVGDKQKTFQLYVRGDANYVDDMIQRAVDAGYDALAITVDLAHYSRRERDLSKRFITTARSRHQGIHYQSFFSWDDIKRIRDKFDIPLMLKGIATAEDAVLACDHGVEVVYVSNHGGRQLDHGRGSLDVLPEVVAAVDGRADVMIDGGFLRGTDVVKAMALGAKAVGIGRLSGFAIAADGVPGVVRMLEILEHEIIIALGLLGVRSFAELNASYVYKEASAVNLPHVMSGFPLLDEDY